ncbi:MAG TPA: DEAD/DEAH box helicase family protein, partial [Candidatus Hydrogenedentes bacterium]|nr:DEAD/DEAH box helicase family protein [Candidatus Hydrogenedentota bacterium]
RTFTGSSILSHALNLTQPEIFKTVTDADGHEKRVRDEERTIVARATLERMRGAFKTWLDDNPEQVERLERLYNEQKNLYVRPVFDGSHLRFPGASEALNLRPYQANVVWRMIQQGRGLIAHAVGAGKTRVIIASTMESRRLGLAKKPMVVVQNSTLMQFASTFRECYPGAKVLVATKKDLVANKRRRFLGRIASGDYDAVIIGQSSFDLIPNDPLQVKQYIQSQIDDLEQSIRDQGEDPNSKSRRASTSVKRLRKALSDFKKRLTSIEQSLKERQDDMLFWENLGIDMLIMDEAHEYKKPPFATKLERLVGLSTETSQKAMNLGIKAQHIRSKRHGKGIILSTGTPVTNTLGEAWHMINFIAPDTLEEFGVQTFDRFISSFANIEPTYEQNAAGRMVSKLGITSFSNVPELKQMLHANWDVITTEELHALLPTLGESVPKIKGGKPEIVAVPITEPMDQFKTFLRQVYDRFKKLNGKQKREYSWVPVLTYNAGRAAALDIRLVMPNMPDDPGSKVNRMVDNALEIYKEVSKNKGTQLIFVDQRNKQNLDRLWSFAGGGRLDSATEDDTDSEDTSDTPSEVQDFLHRDIASKLIAGGVPASEIALMADNDTDAQKEALFEKVNSGEVRFLIGSTKKMGVGVNVQQRCYALHHLDAPWLPADLEQREGRIVRFGNMFKEVRILSYGMEGTLDAAVYSKLLRKAQGIRQILSTETSEREIDDPASADVLTFEEQVLALSDDPLAIEKMVLENRLRTLRIESEGHNRTQRNIRARIQDEKKSIQETEDHIAKEQALYAALPEIKESELTGSVDGVKLNSADKIAGAINKAVTEKTERFKKEVKANKRESSFPGIPITKKENLLYDATIGPYSVRTYCGIEKTLITVDGKIEPKFTSIYFTHITGGPLGSRVISYNGHYGKSIVSKVTEIKQEIHDTVDGLKRKLNSHKKSLSDLEKNVGKTFEKAGELAAAEQRLDEIKRAVGSRERSNQPSEEEEDSPYGESGVEADSDTPTAAREKRTGKKGARKEEIIPPEPTAARTNAYEGPAPVPMPELARMVKDMLGSFPTIKRRLRAKGYFKYERNVGTITLRSDIFIGPAVHHAYSSTKPTEDQISENKGIIARELGVSADDLVVRSNRQGSGYVTSTYLRDHDYASKTIAHEIGHADDWLPDQDMRRGNTLGRIAKLSHYLKQTLAPSGNPEEALSPKDRRQIRKRAEGVAAQDFSYKEDPDRFNARVNYLYAQFVQEEIEQRGLYHDRDIGMVGSAEWGGGYVTPGIRTELISLSMWWKGAFDPEGDSAYDKMRRSSKELYADAISVLLNAPDVLADRAPQFHDALTNFFHKHQPMADLYRGIQEELHAG